jgi:hypothetical protein
MTSLIQRFRDRVENVIKLLQETSEDDNDSSSEKEEVDDAKYDDDESGDADGDESGDDDGDESGDDDGDESGDDDDDDESGDDDDDDESGDDDDESGDDDDESGDDDDTDIIANNWDDNEKSIYALTEQEPNTLQIFFHKPYFYLSDAQTRFSTEVDILNSDPIEYILYVYIVCNNTNFDPYLACLLNYDEMSKSYTFPKIIYDPISLKEDDTHDIFVQNMCYAIIYPLFQIDETQVTSDFIEKTKDCFKGSLHYEGMKHGILGFNGGKFIKHLQGDYKNLSEHYHKKMVIPPYTWACLHEILVNKRVHNISVHPDVQAVFNEYEWLKDIKTETNKNTEMPKMLYSCTIKDNKIYHSQTDIEKSKYLPPVSYHPVLERIRFFTNELDEVSSAESFQMPRYIVFLGEVKVIEPDKTDVAFDLITSVQFKHENVTIYGVFSCDCIYSF